MLTYLKISEMKNDEVIELAQICSAMFSSVNLTDASATAYQYMLQNKFPAMKGDKVIALCAEAAAYPPKDGVKFSPSFMATILRGHEKINQTMNHQEHVATQEERYAFRQEFLKDLYADFDDFKNGVKPTRVKVWQYVAELFVRKGIADRMPVHHEQRGITKSLNDLMTVNENFVLDCYRKLINNNRHVSEIINGLEN